MRVPEGANILTFQIGVPPGDWVDSDLIAFLNDQATKAIWKRVAEESEKQKQGASR